MKIKWIIPAAVILALVVVVGIVVSTSPRLPKAAVIAVTAETTPVPEYLQGLEEKMFDPAIDAQGRASLAEKIEMYKTAEAIRQNGLAAPASKDPAQAQAPDMAAPQGAGAGELPSGIFEGSDGMVRPEEGRILNYLQRNGEDGSSLLVFAGHSAVNEQEGLIIIASLNSAREMVEYVHYTHAAQVGALRILADEGGRIQLQATDESIWYFDLATRTFGQ